jgi:1-aminocyclopropane-1-carboxylate deaminase
MLDFEKILHLPSPLQPLQEPLFEKKKVQVFVKRDDLIHSEISGNKWRKLKHNLLNINALNLHQILTFGGAFSNHIYATAAAGKYFGLATIGIIRGEELNCHSSPTLTFASECGMKLFFVSRNDFRILKQSNDLNFIEKILQEKYFFSENLQQTFIIPEGGTNDWALRGGAELVDEIIEQLGQKPDYILTAVGSGGTLAGIASNVHPEILPIGIAVLKNAGFIFEEIKTLLYKNKIQDFHFETILDAHCGGYAKTSNDLINFIKDFEAKHSILLDQVYTGKLFFDFYEKIKIDFFKENALIVLVHTGGLQGRNSALLP